MKELAAYLMLVVSGKESPSSDDIKGVLSSVGIEASDEEVTRVLASVEGKDLDAIIEAGKKKLVSVGGGGGAAPAAGGAAPAGGAAAKVEEKKKEEVRRTRLAVGCGGRASEGRAGSRRLDQRVR